MKYLKQNKLYCFSPPVMIATFCIEIAFAAHTVWKYKFDLVTKIATAMLVCLAVFQLAEYSVCEGTQGFDGVGWARLGYASITLLPPLGIHLVAAISGDKKKWVYTSAYALSSMFIAYFLFVTGGISAGACLGNYVIFEQGRGTGWLYGLYYYGLLVAGIIYATKLAHTAKPNIRSSLYAFVAGYALFMIPTTLVNIVDPSTIASIPSIMCGFAVVLAVVLSQKVLPEYRTQESFMSTVKRVFTWRESI